MRTTTMLDHSAAERRHIERKFVRFQTVLAATVLFISVAILVGWIIGVAPLRDAFPQLCRIAFHTVLGLALGSTGALVLNKQSAGRKRAGQFLAAGVLLLGALGFVQAIASLFWGVSQPSAGYWGWRGPVHMCPSAALSLLCAGAALLLTDWKTTVAQGVALSGGILSLTAIFGYIFNVGPLQRLGPDGMMSLSGALLMVGLNTSIVWLRPSQGLLDIWCDPSRAGRQLRLLWPTALIITFAIHWISFLGYRTGLYSAELKSALVAVSNLLAIGWLVWWSESKLRSSESALDQSQNRFHELAEAMAHIVWTADSVGSVDYVNWQWNQLTGVPGQGRSPWLAIVQPEDRLNCELSWQDALSSGKPWETQCRFLDRQTREYRWYLGRAIPVTDAQGRVDRWFGSWTNIDAQKRAEENLERRVIERTRELERSQEQLHQAQKMDAIGRLAGGIAHDFNNLLTVMIGSAEGLQRVVSGNEKARLDVDEIVKAARQAAQLTRQLLGFSRRQLAAPRVINLNIIIKELEARLRRSIPDHIECQMALSASLGYAKADPQQVEQILMNLIGNARDAMPHGGRLHVQTMDVDIDAIEGNDRFEVPPGKYVMLAVSDTGMGMTRHVMAHLFEPFFTTKEHGKGTGLGLAMVYGIVKQNSGAILVDSKENFGTTVKVFLPRIIQTEAALTTSDKPFFDAPSLSVETILVAEDEELVRNLTVRILRSARYNVLVAANGHEAVKIVQNTSARINLLLTDVVMPGMNGMELARKLQGNDPDLKVLFVSGYSENVIVLGGMLQPGVELLDKPFTSQQMLHRVRQVLDGKTTQTAHRA